MKTTINFTLPLTFQQLADLTRQLPKPERIKLASLLQQEDEAPTKEQVLTQLKEDYIALQKGTLKTKSLKDVLNEL